MLFYKSVSYKSYPFVRLLVPFIAGILLQSKLNFLPNYVYGIIVFALLLLFIFKLLQQYLQFKLRWIQGLCIMIILAGLGSLLYCWNYIPNHEEWFGSKYNKSSTTIVTIEEPLIEKNKTYKALASVNFVENNKTWQPAVGKILVYFKKDADLTGLTYGSQVVLTSIFQEIQSSGNPGAFDYKQYCLFHGITHQTFVGKNQFLLLKKNNSTWFKSVTFRMRDASIGYLKKYVPGKKEQGIAEALLIGYKNDLDKKLVQSYSNTGVVHIIAISGLHLGMIFWLLHKLLFFLNRKTFLRWTKAIIIVIILWMFTFIAGAAPSIMRAAVMFTFITIAEASGLRNNIYNTLAASAFSLLAINPFFLWDVGFQLSYAALLGIIILKKPIENILYIHNPILEKIWQMNAITFSAQIFTIPIILYYFHQFSNLFWLANLVAVPLSGLILYLMLALLLFTFIPVLASFTGGIIQKLILFLNRFIEKIDSFSFTVWENIYMDLLIQIMLFAFIIGLTLYIVQRRKNYLLISLSFLAIISLYRAVQVYSTGKQEKFIVYNLSNYASAEFISGNTAFYFGDTAALHDAFALQYNLKPAHIMHRISQTQVYNTSELTGIIEFKKKKLLFIDNEISLYPQTEKITVDAIIISRNPFISIASIHKYFNFKFLIFDSSNPMWKIEEWKKECDTLHLRFHSVQDQGAFIWEM